MKTGIRIREMSHPFESLSLHIFWGGNHREPISKRTVDTAISFSQQSAGLRAVKSHQESLVKINLQRHPFPAASGGRKYSSDLAPTLG